MKMTISYIRCSLLVVYCVKAISTAVDYSWKKSMIMYFNLTYVMDSNYYVLCIQYALRIQRGFLETLFLKVIDTIEKLVCLFISFNRLYFQSSFKFSAKLSRRNRDFPHIYEKQTPNPILCIASPFINIINKKLFQFVPICSQFVVSDEFTWTQNYHPQSTVYIRVHSCCPAFYGFGQLHNDRCPSL